MSKVEEFREAVNANEEWQEEVKNFGDDDNIVNYASGKGYEFTNDEYSEYMENNISGELSLFETELVSGGGGGKRKKKARQARNHSDQTWTNNQW